MRILLITFLCLTFTFTNAQKLTISEVESQTYNSFVASDYKTTIKIGKEALQQGIDSYAIRYRIGVSYFVNQNYEAAITHLENAKAIDSNDATLLEYLYYAYTFTNRNEKAQTLSEIFPDDLKAKINFKQKLFKSIAIEVGALQTNSFKDFKANGILANNIAAQGTFYSDVLFANLTVSNQISKNFRLDNSINAVSNTSNNMFQYRIPTIQAIQTKIFTDNNNYFQWNAIGTYYFKGWHIGGGFGLYDSSYITYTPDANFLINQTYSVTKTTSINYSGSLSISKHLKYIEPSLGVSYTDLSS